MIFYVLCVGCLITISSIGAADNSSHTSSSHADASSLKTGTSSHASNTSDTSSTKKKTSSESTSPSKSKTTPTSPITSKTAPTATSKDTDSTHTTQDSPKSPTTASSTDKTTKKAAQSTSPTAATSKHTTSKAATQPTTSSDSTSQTTPPTKSTPPKSATKKVAPSATHQDQEPKPSTAKEAPSPHPPKSTIAQHITAQHKPSQETKTSPAAAHQAVSAMVHTKPEKKDGPDTQNVDLGKVGVRGNWVKKRTWLLKAKTQNSKVQDLVVTIQESRKPFWVTYRDVQEEIDTFYQNMGPKLEDIHDVYPQITQKSSESKKENDSTPPQHEKLTQKPPQQTTTPGLLTRSWRWIKQLIGLSSSPDTHSSSPGKHQSSDDEELKELRNKYKDFTTALDDVKKLDKALEERIEKLDDVVSKAVEHARTSLNLYNDIWDIIDDTKAEHNFYQIKTITKQLKAMHEYITQTLHHDFTSMVQSAKSHMNKARLGAKTLLKEELKEEHAHEQYDEKQSKTPELVHIEEVLKQKAADAEQALKEGATYAKQKAEGATEALAHGAREGEQEIKKEAPKVAHEARSIPHKTGGFFKNIWTKSVAYTKHTWGNVKNLTRGLFSSKSPASTPASDKPHANAIKAPEKEEKSGAK